MRRSDVIARAIMLLGLGFVLCAHARAAHVTAPVSCTPLPAVVAGEMGWAPAWSSEAEAPGSIGDPLVAAAAAQVAPGATAPSTPGSERANVRRTLARRFAGQGANAAEPDRRHPREQGVADEHASSGWMLSLSSLLIAAFIARRRGTWIGR